MSILRSLWGCSHPSRSGGLTLAFWSRFWTLAGTSLAWEWGLCLPMSEGAQLQSREEKSYPALHPWAGGAAGAQQSTGMHWMSTQEGLSASQCPVLVRNWELAASVREVTMSCTSAQAELGSVLCPAGGKLSRVGSAPAFTARWKCLQTAFFNVPHHHFTLTGFIFDKLSPPL